MIKRVPFTLREACIRVGSNMFNAHKIDTTRLTSFILCRPPPRTHHALFIRSNRYTSHFTMSDKELETKKLICELCRQFFEAGWVTGTGGSISIRNDDRIFMTPSGVQKERIQPDEIFTVNIKGEVVDTPAQKLGGRVPKLSDCAPLFLHAYQQRNAGDSLNFVWS